MRLDLETLSIVLRKRVAGPRRELPDQLGLRRAGVLVPLVGRKGEASFLFTKRTERVETHKGQISFPGGVVDASDADVRRTALREAEEEIGLPAAAVEVVGLLDDLQTPTGFIITPVVGLVGTLPPLVPNPTEVAEVFTVPVDFFMQPGNGWTERRVVRGVPREIWLYQCGPHLVWGATAAVIRSLVERLAPEMPKAPSGPST